MTATKAADLDGRAWSRAMNAPATIDHDATEIPPDVLDALDGCRTLVSGPVIDLDAMFRHGAATVFRTIVKADPHWQRTIDTLDLIGEQAGLFDVDRRQQILDAAAKRFRKARAARQGVRHRNPGRHTKLFRRLAWRHRRRTGPGREMAGMCRSRARQNADNGNRSQHRRATT